MKKIFLFCVALSLVMASARGADSPKDGSADELWQAIQKVEHGPAPRDRGELSERLGQLRVALLGFEQQYPGDPRHWDAKLARMQIESGMAQTDDHTSDDAALLALTKEIIAAPDASAETKADARYVVAEKRLEAFESAGSITNGPVRAAAEAAIQELHQKYPDDVRTLQIQFDLVSVLKSRDLAAAAAMLHELETNKNPQTAALAHQQLVTMNFKQNLAKAPLDLKFVAVDGTQVDLAKLRGKVVLLDFWATWCGPCRMELPNVIATYKGLHSQGFEIVGISLDQNKEQMVKFTAAAGMTWPQYFDGKMWSNEISTRYGISAIPAAWLVDKKGFVRSTEARGAELEQEVKTLLAE